MINQSGKSLPCLGYQISLAMELRWRVLPSGSAIKFVAIPATSRCS